MTPLGNRIGPVGVMTPAVEAATSFLKTAGVLLGLWVVLFVVGLALRVIPPESGWLPGSATSEETDADPEVADALDAEVLLDAGASEETLAPDAGVVLASEPVPPPLTMEQGRPSRASARTSEVRRVATSRAETLRKSAFTGLSAGECGLASPRPAICAS